MKILFALLRTPNDLENSGMYADLIVEFCKHNHEVTIISGSQDETKLYKKDGIRILRVKSLPILYVKNLIKNGIGMAMLPYFFKRAYNKYLKNEKFDWIVMPTPPITLIDVVKHIKKRSEAKLYMILRDIHPQSSASLGEIKYKWMVNYLYKRSDVGYKTSDIIGCMSQANIDYIQKEHVIPNTTKCRVLYNWMNYIPYDTNNGNCDDIRKKYNLSNKYIVLFGGNIGLGQRIENIIDLAKHYIKNKQIVFAVIGKGVKKDELQRISEQQNLTNIIFLDFMPRNEYLQFVKSVDLGLISIHEENAAPTCPSKIISYMSLKIPILALINKNNDYGNILKEKAKAGFWTVGSDKKKVYELFDKLYEDKLLRQQMGENGYRFYKENLTTEKIYNEMNRQMLE